MKVQVYYNRPEVPEPVLRLQLRQSASRQEVCVVAVDEDGVLQTCGYLITFNEDGTLYRHTSVNPGLGLRLDKDGRVEIT